MSKDNDHRLILEEGHENSPVCWSCVFLLLAATGCVRLSPSTDILTTETVPLMDAELTPEKEEPQVIDDIAAGAGHSCLLTTTGRIECWGANQYGQLGGLDGPFHSLNETNNVIEGRPQDWVKANVSGLSGLATAISAGAYHSCASINGGGVQCWGWNAFGQLGDGTTSDRNAAVAVLGLDAQVVALSLGNAHTCALLETGKVNCWGSNEYGQLGNGSNQISLFPVAVQGLPARIIEITSGGSFTCALAEEGQLFCWGNGANGLFGDGKNDTCSKPVLVDGMGRDIEGIVAGEYHLCARTTNGEILCWGGLSSAEEFTSHSPLHVEDLTGSTEVLAAGSGHTCALTGVDGVKCWGDNYFGQLGDGSFSGSWKPVVAAAAGDDVFKITSGAGHLCALLMEGGVRCWGDCSSGQCGDDTLQWAWSLYPNHKYNFSMEYPSHWNVSEIAGSDVAPESEHVWFSSSNEVPEQTGARPEVVLIITPEDPLANWGRQFFDNYKEETIRLGNASGLKISGTNKESHQDEMVIIVEAGDYYIQVLPNLSAESLKYLNEILFTLQIARALVPAPGGAI